MSSPPAVRAALYRLLCSSHGCAPTAAEAVLALKKQGVAADDEQVLQALGATVAEAADADALVAECVKRLRESDDGGENDLDKSLAEGARVVPVPTDVTNFASWEREESPRGTAEWVVPASASTSADRILFLHGGGYMWYSPSDVYRPFTTRLATRLGLPLLAIDYRLAPEHAAPAAVDDAVAALRWIKAHGPNGESAPARNIVLVGDSAGGGLALAALAALHAEEVAAGPAGAVAAAAAWPAAVVTFSAWTDLASSLPSYTSRAYDAANGRGDPLFSHGDPAAEIAASVDGAKPYVGGLDWLDPRASPLHTPAAALRRLPPTLMLVGDVPPQQSRERGALSPLPWIALPFAFCHLPLPLALGL